jgi:hypothetical protein
MHPILKSDGITTTQDANGWWSFSYTRDEVRQSVIDGCREAVAALNTEIALRMARSQLEREIRAELHSEHQAEIEAALAENDAEWDDYIADISDVWCRMVDVADTGFSLAEMDDLIDELGAILPPYDGDPDEHDDDYPPIIHGLVDALRAQGYFAADFAAESIAEFPPIKRYAGIDPATNLDASAFICDDFGPVQPMMQPSAPTVPPGTIQWIDDAPEPPSYNRVMARLARRWLL